MSRLSEVAISAARTPLQLEEARELFLEYADSLGFPLTFQNFDRELRELPGDYSPPHGEILLAHLAGQPAGCVALRPLEAGTCEMKRLYVRPAHRRSGAGRALAKSIIDVAQAAGYDRMRLDTVPSMRAARTLYAALGFREIEAYRFNPISGTSFMELDLVLRR